MARPDDASADAPPQRHLFGSLWNFDALGHLPVNQTNLPTSTALNLKEFASIDESLDHDASDSLGHSGQITLTPSTALAKFTSPDESMKRDDFDSFGRLPFNQTILTSSIPLGEFTGPDGTLNRDVLLHFLESFDSPRELLAFVSANPVAYRLWTTYRQSILVNLFRKNLSLQGIQTAIRLSELINSKTGFNIRKLRQAGAKFKLGDAELEIDFNTIQFLPIKTLETIFQIWHFHEPFAKECLAQPWLLNREYLTMQRDLNRRSAYSHYAIDHLRERLERPCKGGEPLSARILSGLFSFELWLRDGLRLGTGSIDFLYGNREETLRAFAQLYGLPEPVEYNWHTIWGNADLMVDLSLVSLFMKAMSDKPCGCEDCQMDGDNEDQQDSDPVPQPGLLRMRRLWEICLPRTEIGGVNVNWIGLRGTSCHDMMNRIMAEWRDQIDFPVPAPYTWAIGHREPDAEPESENSCSMTAD